MKIKRYRKNELAMRYFPDASEPKVALILEKLGDPEITD